MAGVSGVNDGSTSVDKVVSTRSEWSNLRYGGKLNTIYSKTEDGKEYISERVAYFDRNHDGQTEFQESEKLNIDGFVYERTSCFADEKGCMSKWREVNKYQKTDNGYIMKSYDSAGDRCIGVYSETSLSRTYTLGLDINNNGKLEKGEIWSNSVEMLDQNGNVALVKNDDDGDGTFDYVGEPLPKDKDEWFYRRPSQCRDEMKPNEYLLAPAEQKTEIPDSAVSTATVQTETHNVPEPKNNESKFKFTFTNPFEENKDF